MKNPVPHGDPPFRVAVLHGGPGAAGEAGPLAEELSMSRGVLEPLQTRATIDGQVRELEEMLKRYAERPVDLVGHSWGAMLGLVFAARNPELVRKLIMVSSGVFDESYVPAIGEKRLERMTAEQRLSFFAMGRALEGAGDADRDALFARLGSLLSETDAYDAVPREENVRYDYEIFTGVWGEAEALRRDGRLLDMAGRVRCPVVAIHGEDDPHPADGVRVPLAARLPDFTFFLLKECGHKPWVERLARRAFFDILDSELR